MSAAPGVGADRQQASRGVIEADGVRLCFDVIASV